MFNHIGRLRKQIMVKDQESKAVAEENKALRAALDASETKRKAVEAAMEKKEREFNERASVRALAARMRAAADAAARGDTPIPRLVRQKARRNRVGLTRIQDKSEPRRGRKAVATNSGLLSRRESRAGVLKRHTCKRRRPTISLSLNPSAPHHYPISRLLQQAPTAPRQVSNLGSKFFARNC